MTLGYDTNTPPHFRCHAKAWTENCAAGIMLTVTGTPMPPDAICDGIKPALDFASAQLQNCLDSIASSSGSEDLVYAGTRLLDCCKQINEHVLVISAFAGQGIYLGGVITYFAGSHFLHIPFGGGCLYSFENEKLNSLGELPDPRLIRDAIGGGQTWEGHCWQNSRKPGMRLIFSCAPFVDILKCEQILHEHSTEQSHMNTASMMLCRDLMNAYPGSPTAVMELRI